MTQLLLHHVLRCDDLDDLCLGLDVGHTASSQVTVGWQHSYRTTWKLRSRFPSDPLLARIPSPTLPRPPCPVPLRLNKAPRARARDRITRHGMPLSVVRRSLQQRARLTHTLLLLIHLRAKLRDLSLHAQTDPIAIPLSDLGPVACWRHALAARCAVLHAMH